MEIEVWQLLVLTIFSFVQIVLHMSIGESALSRPVTAGVITGLVMGDVETGLFIGGTMELMSLGVAAFGGASVPDYFTATLIGTTLAVVGGLSPEEAVALAVPVALLMVQLDVFGRMANTALAQKAFAYASKGDLKGVVRSNILGILPWGLSRAIPVFVALALGTAVVEELLALIPESIMAGLGVAAGMLPVVGIAILLRYLPFSKLFVYFLMGFILSSVFGLNLLLVTIVAFIIVTIMYQTEIETSKRNVNENGLNNLGGEIDD